MDSTYRCNRCGNIIPVSNKALHDLRCQGGNLQNQNQNYNQNRRNDNNFNSFSYFNNNINNSMNNNMVSFNTNTTKNPDGTFTVTKTETYQNGMQRITTTQYDQYHNKISEQVRNSNLNNNNYNNNMMINNNNNMNFQRSVDQNGNVTDVRTEQLSNGMIRKTSTTRDRNGNILMQNMSTIPGNNSNNIQSFNMSTNNMNNAMNSMNYDISSMNNNDINTNNMMMNLNNMFNNMNQMFNNMFNNGLGYMNFNNMGNMNNMNYGNYNTGVDPTILNNFASSKLKDISKLEDDKRNCIICMEDFINGDEVIYLPCLHVFHNTCILEWLKMHNDCPVCKFKITMENLYQNQ